MIIKSSINKLMASKKSQQVLTLYGSMIMGLVLSIGVSIFNTRILGPEAFGNFKLLQNMFNFVITGITLGTFVSAARLIALETDREEKRKLYGGILVAVIFIYLIMALLFFSFSFVQGDLFENDLGNIIRLLLPVIFAFPLQLCLVNVLKGDNRINSLALLRFLPSALYLICAYSLLSFSTPSMESLILLNVTSTCIIAGIIFYRLQPRFNNLREKLFLLISEIKHYGFHVYIAILAGVWTAHLGGIMVGFYEGSAAAGFFLLAQSITIPLVFVAHSIGEVLYKKFAHSTKIPTKIILVTFAIAILTLVAYLLVIADLVSLVYPPEFGDIIPLVYLMAIGAITLGLGGFLNSFTCARGYGEYARNAAFIRGSVYVSGYIVIIPIMGLIGAAWTSMVTGCVALAAEYYYYCKATKKLNDKQNIS